MNTLLKTSTLAIALLAACAPAEIGRENARAYFGEYHTKFERLVEQVELCRPLEGRYERTSDIHCSKPDRSSEELRDAIGRVDAPWIRIWYTGRNAEGLVRRILIAMPSSFGVSFAGVIEAFVYENEPDTVAAYERTDYREGAYIERLPVTDAPHHWYWQKIDR